MVNLLLYFKFYKNCIRSVTDFGLFYFFVSSLDKMFIFNARFCLKLYFLLLFLKLLKIQTSYSTYFENWGLGTGMFIVLTGFAKNITNLFSVSLAIILEIKNGLLLIL